MVEPGNLHLPPPLSFSPFPTSSDSIAPSLSSNQLQNTAPSLSTWDNHLRHRTATVQGGADVFSSRFSKRECRKKKLEDHLRDWVQKKMDSGVADSRCFVPFLVNAPKMVKCLLCHKFIHPGEELLRSVQGCDGGYHLECLKMRLGISDLKNFKCPQHACFLCKQKQKWRMVRCTVASHDESAPWPDEVIHFEHVAGIAVCWRHSTDSRLNKQNALPTNNIEEIFCCLPLPYVDEEFKSTLSWNDVETEEEPLPYVHIRRNVYLTEEKSDGADEIGCRCSSVCPKNCVCRYFRRLQLNIYELDQHQMGNRERQHILRTGFPQCAWLIANETPCLCRSQLKSCSKFCHCRIAQTGHSVRRKGLK